MLQIINYIKLYASSKRNSLYGSPRICWPTVCPKSLETFYEVAYCLYGPKPYCISNKFLLTSDSDPEKIVKYLDKWSDPKHCSAALCSIKPIWDCNVLFANMFFWGFGLICNVFPATQSAVLLVQFPGNEQRSCFSSFSWTDNGLVSPVSRQRATVLLLQFPGNGQRSCFSSFPATVNGLASPVSRQQAAVLLLQFRGNGQRSCYSSFPAMGNSLASPVSRQRATVLLL